MADAIAMRAGDLASVAGILLAGGYGVFVLPYAFPPSEPTFSSPSYMLGFSNRVAVLATLATIGMLCLRNLLWRQANPEAVDRLFCDDSVRGAKRFPNMPKSVLWLFVGLYLVLTFLLYACIPHLGDYGEPLGFFPRLELGVHYHLRPYSEVEWPYGPALFYLPQWFMQASLALGGSEDLGYLICYACFTVAGLWALFFFVNKLRIKVAHRVLIFSLLCLAAYNFTLGLNGNLVRFVVPYAVLLLMHATTSRMAPFTSRGAVARLCGIAAACAVAGFLLSIEAGIAYTVAQAAYCIHRVFYSSRAWLYALAATVVVLPLWLLAFPGCLVLLVGFSKGSSNIPLFPGADIVLYLLTLCWLLPILLRTIFSTKPGPNVPLVMAMALLILAVIPAALGRCFGLHVILNGVGAFLLAMAVIARYRPRLLAAYGVVFLIVFGVMQQVANVQGYAEHLRFVRAALAGKRMSADNEPSPLIAALKLDDFPDHSLAVPMGIDRLTRSYLIETRRLAPLYDPDLINVQTRGEMENHIASLRKVTLVLVPEWIMGLRGMSDEQAQQLQDLSKESESQSLLLGEMFFYPVDFKAKHVPFSPFIAAGCYIARNYDVVRSGGGYLIMKPKAVDTGLPTPESPLRPDDQSRPPEAGRN